jgi:hypothetical protein
MLVIFLALFAGFVDTGACMFTRQLVSLQFTRLLESLQRGTD